MSVITDLFTALFYTEPGMYLGILIIVGLIVALMVTWKYVVFITVPLTLYFAISYTGYFSNEAPISIWMFIMLMFFSVVQGLYGVLAKERR